MIWALPAYGVEAKLSGNGYLEAYGRLVELDASANPDNAVREADPYGLAGLVTARLKLVEERQAFFAVTDTLTVEATDDPFRVGTDAEPGALANHLQELYFKARPGKGRLTLQLGKVNVVDGVAYAWAPTDFLARPTIAVGTTTDQAFLRELRPGLFMATGTVLFGDGLSAQLVLAPLLPGIPENENHRVWGRFGAAVGPMDLGLSALYDGAVHGGASSSAGLGDHVVAYAEAVVEQGTEVAVVAAREETMGLDVLEPRFRTTSRDFDMAVTGVLGASVTPVERITWILETRATSAYASSEDRDAWFDAVELLGPRVSRSDVEGDLALEGLGDLLSHYAFSETAPLYVFTSLTWTRGPIAAGMRLLANPFDQSGLVSPNLSYVGTRQPSAYLQGNLYAGRARSEFGQIRNLSSLAIGLRGAY